MFVMHFIDEDHSIPCQRTVDVSGIEPPSHRIVVMINIIYINKFRMGCQLSYAIDFYDVLVNNIVLQKHLRIRCTTNGLFTFV